MLREGLRLIVCSLVIGGICTAIARPLLQTFAYQGRPGDFAIIVLPALLLAGVAFLASCLPARRAAALDPLDALGQR